MQKPASSAIPFPLQKCHFKAVGHNQYIVNTKITTLHEMRDTWNEVLKYRRSILAHGIPTVIEDQTVNSTAIKTQS